MEREGNLHIAQIGTGRVGRPTAYTLLCAELADTLTVCDTKPRLAAAFAEELKHVAASLGLDVEIVACEKDECVAGADVILISAGEPRIAGVQMSRRDLALQNGKIVKYVAEVTSPRNPSAKYIVITNPVDAMAMVCKKYSKADFVVSTGTNLESLRFRSRIAETLGVPVSKVSGWVGGEHGDAAVPLWSTVKVDGKPIDDYAKDEGKPFNKTEVDSYVKLVSKQIVDNIGGTEYGPAASFRDILRAIVNDTGETLSISTPVNLEWISEPVFVGVPLRLGKSVGPTLYKELSIEERKALIEAGKAIYQTYLTSISGMT
ncbi:MAG: malate dehydrogenase [Candidatus Bathyarchaeota archaeon]|nr:malate dehydrogenase [Candidatus Bathyarchaeota archaeon]